MDAFMPDRGQPDVDAAPIGPPRLRASPLVRSQVSFVRASPRWWPVPPDRVDVTAARTKPPVPSLQSQLPSTVRRAPRLWSILYDGLSVSDQRWVLDAIARYRRA